MKNILKVDELDYDFARVFKELNKKDQQEILNLIAFKKAMKIKKTTHNKLKCGNPLKYPLKQLSFPKR